MVDIQIEQIDAMRMGVDYSFTIELRGYRLRSRPLSIFETVRVAQQVADDISKMPPQARVPLIESVTLAKETLIRASTSDVDKNDPTITSMVLDRTTPDEILSLYSQYLAGVDRVNPVLETMSKEKLNELVETLKKKPKEELASALTALSQFELVNLVRTLLIGD